MDGGINLFAYADINPLSYIDPLGQAVETGWDVFNVATGIASFSFNAASGNLIAAAVDAVTLTYDLVATAIPCLPAGASVTVQLYRGSRLARAMNDLAQSTGSLRYVVIKGIDQAHHLVPRTAQAAKPARDKLASLGIDIDDAFNGVALPTKFHSSLHSGEYYQTINRLSRGWTTREQAIADLETFARQLLQQSGKVR